MQYFINLILHICIFLQVEAYCSTCSVIIGRQLSNKHNNIKSGVVSIRCYQVIVTDNDKSETGIVKGSSRFLSLSFLCYRFVLFLPFNICYVGTVPHDFLLIILGADIFESV